jgi:PAS domain S-box-containing protein
VSSNVVPINPVASPSASASERDIYLKIFEHSKDSIFLITPGTGAIVFANPRAVEDTSYEAEELNGLDFRTLFLPEDQAAINTLLETTLQWKTGVDPQRNLKRKTGRKIIVEISSSIVELQGTSTIFCSVRDITARIKAEEKIKQYSKELETINAELEDRVKARTSELASAMDKLGETNSLITRQKKELDDVMSNIKQAIFTVSRECKINPEYSKFVAEVFGAKTPENSDIADFLYEAEDRDSKGKTLKEGLVLTYEQPETWDLVKDLLPKQLKYLRPGSDATSELRDLKFEWCPIIVDGSVLKVMVVCIDITEQKKLEEAMVKQEAEHNEQLELISQLINLPSEIVSQFVSDSKRMLVGLKGNLGKIKDQAMDDENKQDMMRTMHTLKGSARQFGLRSVQTTAHEIESKVLANAAFDEALLIEFGHLEKALGDVHTFYDKTTSGKPSSTSEGEQISVPLRKIEFLLDTFPLEKRRTHTDTVFNAVHWLLRAPIKPLFDNLTKLAQSLAEDLGKEVHVEMIGAEVQIDSRLAGPLSDAFLHVVRNTMDHGAEPPDERESLGKPRPANLTLSLSLQEDHFLFEISDDGRGVNVEKVKERAVSRGLISAEAVKTAKDEDVVQYIFLPGFSTKDQATELSGRGVGMDVVKEVIEKKLGGEVRMYSKPGQGTRLTASVPIFALMKPAHPNYFLPSPHLHREGLESTLGISLTEITRVQKNIETGAVIVSPESVEKAQTEHQIALDKIVCFGQLPTEELVDKIISTQKIHHFVDSTNSFAQFYLDACMKKINRGSIWGLEPYLAPGSVVHSRKLQIYAEKNKVIDSVISFAKKLKGFRGMPEILATITDEMIMNGMFDAPRNAEGREKYNELPRTHPLVLEPQEQITFKFGADAHFVALSVEDPFGAFTFEVLARYLKRCYLKESNQIEQKKGGAGLGLFTIFDSAHCFIVNSHPGKKTEMIALISLSLSFARYQGTGKSFSFFTGISTEPASPVEVPPPKVPSEEVVEVAAEELIGESTETGEVKENE